MKQSQNDKILQFMRTHGSISQRDAVRFGCYRLSARIHDLKQEGHLILAERKAFVNEDGKGWYASYRLVE